MSEVCLCFCLFVLRAPTLETVLADVIAWEHGQTMVTKSQRAVSPGGSANSLRFHQHPFHQCVCEPRLSHTGNTGEQFTKKKKTAVKKRTSRSVDSRDLRAQASLISIAARRNRVEYDCVMCCFDNISQGRDGYILDWG